MVPHVPTLTLKNLPTDVHRKLKARAARHGRSLNVEAITCLRAAVSAEALDVDALLTKARAHRARVATRFTDTEVRNLKRDGRA